MAKDPDRSDLKEPLKQIKPYLKYSGLAIQLVVTIGLAGWLGYLLDNYLQLKYPLFILIFTITAFAAMIYQLYQSINKS